MKKINLCIRGGGIKRRLFKNCKLFLTLTNKEKAYKIRLSNIFQYLKIVIRYDLDTIFREI